MPVYCTTCDPVFAKGAGFVGAKIPCPYGPSKGDKGLKLNVETFKKARESVGPDFPLMYAVCVVSVCVCLSVCMFMRACVRASMCTCV